MIKKDKIMHINVFDGDDGIKYIRYSDMEKMLERIKEVHDKIENDLRIEIKRLKEENKELENLTQLLNMKLKHLLNTKYGKEVKKLYYDISMVEEGKYYE